MNKTKTTKATKATKTTKTTKTTKPTKTTKTTKLKTISYKMNERTSGTLKSSLVFTNRDCISCFSFIERELHFTLRELSKVENHGNIFRPELFKTGGSGNHRYLNYYEFVTIGLIKILNNMGFTIPRAADIIVNKLFKGKRASSPSFSKYFFSISNFYVTTDNGFIKPSRQDIKISTKLQQQVAPMEDIPKSIYRIQVNMMSYNQVIFKYIEKNFRADPEAQVKCTDHETLAAHVVQEPLEDRKKRDLARRMAYYHRQ